MPYLGYSQTVWEEKWEFVCDFLTRQAKGQYRRRYSERYLTNLECIPLNIAEHIHETSAKPNRDKTAKKRYDTQGEGRF